MLLGLVVLGVAAESLDPLGVVAAAVAATVLTQWRLGVLQLQPTCVTGAQ